MRKSHCHASGSSARPRPSRDRIPHRPARTPPQSSAGAAAPTRACVQRKSGRSPISQTKTGRMPASAGGQSPAARPAAAAMGRSRRKDHPPDGQGSGLPRRPGSRQRRQKHGRVKPLAV
jgi:hypothetical protein